MNKLIIGISIAAILSGCASSPKVMECSFPNTDEPAPNWICDEPVAGYQIQALGIAEQSNGGISYMKDLAKLEARAEIANQLGTNISEVVKRYMGSAGTGDDQTINAVGESVKKSVTSKSVSGSRILRSRTGPNGRLYMLMGIDDAIADKVRDSAIKTSMNNAKALWQKAIADKSFEDMQKDIKALSK